MSQQINLYNPLFRTREVPLSATHMAWGIALILLGGLGYYGWLNYRIGELGVLAAQTAKQADVDGTKLEQLTREKGSHVPSKALQEEIARLDEDLKARREMLAALEGGDLGDTRGYSEYLRSLARRISDGVWLTGFEIAGAGRQITLSGATLRPELVPAYVRRLSQDAVMRGKSFAMMELGLPKEAAPGAQQDKLREAKTGVIEFSLSSETEKKDEKNVARAEDTQSKLERVADFSKTMSDIGKDIKAGK